jgi:hypothetical protein
MPRSPVNHTKTVIYKIVSLNPELSGWSHLDSTTEFTKRKCQHKRECATNKNSVLCNFINANGGWAAFQMLYVADFPATNRELVRTHIHSLMNPTPPPISI